MQIRDMNDEDAIKKIDSIQESINDFFENIQMQNNLSNEDLSASFVIFFINRHKHVPSPIFDLLLNTVRVNQFMANVQYQEEKGE